MSNFFHEQSVAMLSKDSGANIVLQLKWNAAVYIIFSVSAEYEP